MRAQVGDRVVVQATRVDEAVRDGEVVEVRGPDGEPPYVVRWSADGHTSLFFPGPDTRVHHHDEHEDHEDHEGRGEMASSSTGLG